MGTFEGVVLSYPPPSRRVGTCEEMVDRIMSFILHPHCDTSLYTWYNYYCILSVLNPWGEEKRVTWRENWRSMENWKRGKGGALEFFKKMSLPSYFLTQLPYPSPSPTPPPPPQFSSRSFVLSLQVRLEAMHHLLQFPPGDLVNCDNWTNLKDAVGSALMEEDTQLAVSTVYCSSSSVASSVTSRMTFNL